MRDIGLEYRIEREEEHWTVCFQGQHCGRFGSRREALHSAVADAERVRGLGYRVHVLVRRADGHLRAVPEHLRRRGPEARLAP